VFVQVSALALPTTLSGLVIRTLHSAEARPSLSLTADAHPDDQFFSLTDDEAGAFILARAWGWHEDDGDDAAPSKFSVPRMVW
jgi:hypothetical protein